MSEYFLVRKIVNRLSSVHQYRRHGWPVFLAEIANRRRLWSARVIPNDSQTSISDGMEYSGFCRLAVEDNKVFKRFKSASQYRAVLEHLDYEQGLNYLELITDNPEILQNLRGVLKYEFGDPFRYPYMGLGCVSPTQIRYAKVLQDLEILFGPISKMSVAEIGVGYGGQAAQILSRWKVGSYDLYDLDWAGRLALKYLQQIPLQFSTTPKLEKIDNLVSFDLVLSNYAFSELYRDVQEMYLQNVILNSRRGYVIYNHIHSNPNSSMSAKEFAEKVPGAEIFEEIPNTFPGNVLVVWGHMKSNLDIKLFKSCLE